MTIQTINIGTVPNDGTGDSARTSFDKINQNFTDPANAAAALVQTSPTDTTAGRVVLTDTLNAMGLNTTDCPAWPNGSDLNDMAGVVNGVKYYLFSNTATTASGWPFDSGSGNDLLISVDTDNNNRRVMTLEFMREKGSTSVTNSYRRVFFSGSWKGWQPVYTGANYQPETAYGIGVVFRARNISGAAIAAGDVVSHTLIRAVHTDLTGAVVANPVPPVGLYMLVSTDPLMDDNISEFVRLP